MIHMDKTRYNPVAEAYKILAKALHKGKDTTRNDHEDVIEYEIAMEEAIGFLGEALED